MQASPAMSTAPGPLRPGERAEILDALRGLALFGILVVNLMSFSEWSAAGAGDADRVTSFLITAFAGGKFYSLFSFLFGVGFAVQLLRADERGVDVAPRFSRRLLVLWGIGMLHLSFLWAGDILALYALLGFLLLPVRRVDDRPLLVAAVVLLALPVVLHALAAASGGALDPGGPFYRLAERVDPAYLANPAWRLGEILHHGRAFQVLAMFFVGFVAARHLVFTDLSAHRGLLRRVAAWGLGFGVPVNLMLAFVAESVQPEYLSAGGVAHSVLYLLAVAPLTLGYAAGFALLWQRPGWRRHLTRLAPAGRMALTNYLGQTAAALFLFYGVLGLGLGLAGKVGPVQVLMLSVAVFAAQVAVSALWLRHLRYGPVEWAWRSLTYGRFQPLLAPARTPAVR